MPNYYFICDCGHSEIHFKSIKDGPPKRVICKNCDCKMYQDLTGQGVIFKGWFPGQEIKMQKDNGITKEENNEKIHQMKRKQEALDESMEARRKGKKASKEFREKNKNTWELAKQATKDGMRPSKKLDSKDFNQQAINSAKKKLNG